MRPSRISKDNGSFSIGQLTRSGRVALWVGHFFIISATIALTWALRSGSDLANPCGLLSLGGYYLVWLGDTSREFS